MKPLTIKSFLPGIAWFFVVLILICMPGEDIPTPKAWFEWLRLLRFDKLVHIGIFAVLGFLFMRPIAKAPFSRMDKWHYFIRICLAVSIWGLTTELIQLFFIPTRDFDLVDWAADSIGGLFALLASYYFFLRKIPKNSELEGSGL
jgi:VanZ family protein